MGGAKGGHLGLGELRAAILVWVGPKVAILGQVGLRAAILGCLGREWPSWLGPGVVGGGHEPVDRRQPSCVAGGHLGLICSPGERRGGHLGPVASRRPPRHGAGEPVAILDAAAAPLGPGSHLGKGGAMKAAILDSRAFSPF